MIVQPYMEDYQVTYLPGTVEIRILGKKRSKQLILMGSYLIYWLFVLAIFVFFFLILRGVAFREGGITYLTILQYLFFPLALLVWGAFGLIAVREILWQIGGMETMEVDAGSLRIRRTIFGIGRTREFVRGKIENITVIPAKIITLPFVKFMESPFKVEFLGPAKIDFEDRAPEYVGLGLDEEQAKKIAVILKQRLVL